MIPDMQEKIKYIMMKLDEMSADAGPPDEGKGHDAGAGP